MELCDPRLVSELVSEYQGGRRRPVRRGTLIREPNSRTPKPRHCKCGTCVYCIENVRWQRIFDEKFADPTYYDSRPPRLGSSLSES